MEKQVKVNDEVVGIVGDFAGRRYVVEAIDAGALRLRNIENGALIFNVPPSAVEKKAVSK